MEFQYYTEFLRYIGIYVYEDFRCDEKDDADFKDEKESAFSISYVANEKIDFTTEYETKEYLQKFLKEIFECNSIENTWLDDLVSIYEKYSLLQASVTLQYFRLNGKELVLNAGKRFEHAADDFPKLIKNPEYLEQKNVRYARLYCKQKANLAQHLYNKSVVYYIDKLAVEGLSILENFPKFSNAWVLLGLIYEISNDFTRDALDAYDRALEMIKGKPYASSVLYWKGRKCETDDILKSVSQDSYIKAYGLAKKYRNIYKVAQIYLEKKDWQQAIHYFTECIEEIQKKGNYLDPLEQEYYFKVNVQMSFAYIEQKKYIDAIIAANNAIQLRKHVLDERDKEDKNNCKYIKFFYKMYANMEPEKYIDLTLGRMGLQNVYQSMAIACEGCGFQEEAETHWKLYREWLNRKDIYEL